MIVIKKWVRPHKYNKQGYLWKGWFLFGVLPLWMVRDGVELP